MSIEVCLQPSAIVSFDEIEARFRALSVGQVSQYAAHDAVLRDNVRHIRWCSDDDDDNDNEQSRTSSVLGDVFVYVLETEADTADDNADDLCVDDNGSGGGGGGETAMFSSLALPHAELEGAWEALQFDAALKRELMQYVRTSVDFGRRGVAAQLVGCNRLVLLHGPPGSGKTSLCRALAHKLAVRRLYAQTVLIEINAHSLFSKWFSESGKLVGRLFARIRALTADEQCLVCVLVDEVESLAAARSAALNGVEPSDAIRVVNALLTQLDRLKHCSNALVMATSNITAAIDVAFLDRADLKLYIGPPGVAARYAILLSCVHELVRTGVVTPPLTLLPFAAIADVALADLTANDDGGLVHLSALLRHCAAACESLSGRTLRKLPFLAVAIGSRAVTPVQIGAFLTHLLQTIERVVAEQKNVVAAAPK